MKKVVLLDLHDTISRSQILIIKYVNLRSGKNYHYWDLTSDHREGKDLIYDAFAKEFHQQPELSKNALPFGKALEAVRLLYAQGYKIHLASGRNKIHYEITKNWLKKHGFTPFIEEFHLRPQLLSRLEFKLNLIKKIQAEAIFDDLKSMAQVAAENNIKVYLIRRPWNRELITTHNIQVYKSFHQAVLGFLVKKIPFDHNLRISNQYYL